MLLYLAGPMRGKEHFNQEMFDAEQMRLERVGYSIVSPTVLDELAGWDLQEMTEGDLPPDWRAQVLERDAKHLARCDGVALLPGWSESAGVKMEMACAAFLGIPVQEVQTWLDEALIHEEHVNGG